MPYSFKTAENERLPLMKVATARAVLQRMDFCPTYFPFGELCHTTECKLSFEFCVLPIPKEEHIVREAKVENTSLHQDTSGALWYGFRKGGRGTEGSRFLSATARAK